MAMRTLNTRVKIKPMKMNMASRREGSALTSIAILFHLRFATLLQHTTGFVIFKINSFLSANIATDIGLERLTGRKSSDLVWSNTFGTMSVCKVHFCQN